MMREHTLRKEYTTKEDWLEDIFTNSNPQASLQSAETALRTFDIFCKVKVRLELEKHLLLESSKVHSEQFHEKELLELRKEMQQQKAQIDKLRQNECPRTKYDASKHGMTS